MKTILAILAAPLAFTAMPAMANDCAGAAGTRNAANNGAVVRDMLAYAYEQAEPRNADCRTGEATAVVPPAPKAKINCVDCPEGRTTTTIA